MSKTVKDVKRPNPQTPRRPLPGRMFWNRGTYDVRRNEWKRLKRGPRTPASLARIAKIERAWAA